jgi:hypothetical protein
MSLSPAISVSSSSFSLATWLAPDSDRSVMVTCGFSGLRGWRVDGSTVSSTVQWTVALPPESAFCLEDPILFGTSEPNLTVTTSYVTNVVEHRAWTRGNLLWSFNATAVSGPPGSTSRAISGVVRSESVVYVSFGAAVTALRADTGQALWTDFLPVTTCTMSYAPPTLYIPSSGAAPVLVQACGKWAVGRATATGAVLWQVDSNMGGSTPQMLRTNMPVNQAGFAMVLGQKVSGTAENWATAVNVVTGSVTWAVVLSDPPNTQRVAGVTARGDFIFTTSSNRVIILSSWNGAVLNSWLRPNSVVSSVGGVTTAGQLAIDRYGTLIMGFSQFQGSAPGVVALISLASWGLTLTPSSVSLPQLELGSVKLSVSGPIVPGMLTSAVVLTFDDQFTAPATVRSMSAVAADLPRLDALGAATVVVSLVRTSTLSRNGYTIGSLAPITCGKLVVATPAVVNSVSFMPALPTKTLVEAPGIRILGTNLGGIPYIAVSLASNLVPLPCRNVVQGAEIMCYLGFSGATGAASGAWDLPVFVQPVDGGLGITLNATVPESLRGMKYAPALPWSGRRGGPLRVGTHTTWWEAQAAPKTAAFDIAAAPGAFQMTLPSQSSSDAAITATGCVVVPLSGSLVALMLDPAGTLMAQFVSGFPGARSSTEVLLTATHMFALKAFTAQQTNLMVFPLPTAVAPTTFVQPTFNVSLSALPGAGQLTGNGAIAALTNTVRGQQLYLLAAVDSLGAANVTALSAGPAPSVLWTVRLPGGGGIAELIVLPDQPSVAISLSSLCVATAHDLLTGATVWSRASVGGLSSCSGVLSVLSADSRVVAIKVNANRFTAIYTSSGSDAWGWALHPFPYEISSMSGAPDCAGSGTASGCFLLGTQRGLSLIDMGTGLSVWNTTVGVLPYPSQVALDRKSNTAWCTDSYKATITPVLLSTGAVQESATYSLSVGGLRPVVMGRLGSMVALGSDALLAIVPPDASEPPFVLSVFRRTADSSLIAPVGRIEDSLSLVPIAIVAAIAPSPGVRMDGNLQLSVSASVSRRVNRFPLIACPSSAAAALAGADVSSRSDFAIFSQLRVTGGPIVGHDFTFRITTSGSLWALPFDIPVSFPSCDQLVRGSRPSADCRSCECPPESFFSDDAKICQPRPGTLEWAVPPPSAITGSGAIPDQPLSIRVLGTDGLIWLSGTKGAVKTTASVQAIDVGSKNGTTSGGAGAVAGFTTGPFSVVLTDGYFNFSRLGLGGIIRNASVNFSVVATFPVGVSLLGSAATTQLNFSVRVMTCAKVNPLTVAVGDTECVCKAGFFQDLATGACLQCPPGSVSEAGSTLCSCSTNYFRAKSGEPCTPCPSGTEKAGRSDGPCSCRPGFVADSPLPSSSCSPCPAGSVFANSTAGCQCIEGFTPSSASAGACVPCETPGTEKSWVGNDACSCAAGFSRVLGRCTPCPSATYRGALASESSCIACPSRSSTRGETGRFNLTQCLCDEGAFLANPATGECASCPAGATCGGALTAPTALPGYYALQTSSSSSTATTEFVRCPRGESCSGGQAVCSPGYQGLLCGTCDKPLYGRVSSRCVKCSKGRDVGLTVGYFAFLALQLVLLIRSSLRPHASLFAILIRSLIDYLQVSFFVGSFGFEWPDAITRVLFIPSGAATGGTEFLPLDCLTSWPEAASSSFFSTLGLTLSGLYAASFVLLLVIIQRSRRGGGERGSRVAPLLVKSLVVITTTLYPAVVSANIRSFRCYPLGSGRRVLFHDVNVTCGSPLHKKMTALATMSLLATNAVMIIIFGALLVPSLRVTSDFLEKPYLPRSRWYGVFVFSRKVAILSIPSFIDSSAAACSAASLVLVVSLVANALIRPHRRDWDLPPRTTPGSAVARIHGLFSSVGGVSAVENLGLAANLITLTAGPAFSRSGSPRWGVAIVVAVNILMWLLTVPVVLGYTLTTFSSFSARKRPMPLKEDDEVEVKNETELTSI